MKNISIALVILLVSFLFYRDYSNLKYDNKVKTLHQYTKMELLGDAFVIHNRLGLAQKRQIHIDVILAHAKNLGYRINPPRIYNDDTGQIYYVIWTGYYRNKRYEIDFFIYTSSEGVVEKIRARKNGDLDLGLTIYTHRLINFICILCEKIPIYPEYSSEYANTGPNPISFPRGREDSIRFKLGLADAFSLHSKAVFNHANFLGYTVLSTDTISRTGNTIMKIETGESIFGRYVQNFLVEIDRDGWIKSIVEKRSKIARQHNFS